MVYKEAGKVCKVRKICKGFVRFINSTTHSYVSCKNSIAKENNPKAQSENIENIQNNMITFWRVKSSFVD